MISKKATQAKKKPAKKKKKDFYGSASFIKDVKKRGKQLKKAGGYSKPKKKK